MFFCTFICKINNKRCWTHSIGITNITDSSVPKLALSYRFSSFWYLLFFSPDIHRRQQMVCYAVIYRCIAGGALLFHKYFCCWIIDRILSAGSVRFHSLSMEWKIWCNLRLTLKPFHLLLLLVVFFFYVNCQGISQHLFQCAIRGISYSWFFIAEHLSVMSSCSCR